MSKAFSCCGNPIVTFVTGLSLHSGVIKHANRPTGHIMARTAVFQRRHMVRRLAGGDGVIMAIHTGTNNFIMVNSRNGYPGVDGMTGFALVGGWNMVCWFTGGGYVIVTGNTCLIANDAVIHLSCCR